MTDTRSDIQPRPLIDLNAVRRQFDRRGRTLADADFLLRDVQARMLDRLNLVKIEPAQVLDVGCGQGGSYQALQQRFAQAQWIGVDLSAAQIAAAEQQLAQQRPWYQGVLKRLVGQAGPRCVQADAASLPLPDASVGMIWSNLMLHWHPDPPAVFREWRRVLSVDGLLMFSVFGPYTLRELGRALVPDHRARLLPFVDMHDLGDMLVHAGYATPVMDMETLTLTYATADAALRDLRALGGNPMVQRDPALRGRFWRDHLLEVLQSLRKPDGLIHLTFEVAFGHAWRPADKSPQRVSTVPISQIGRAPRS